MKDNNQNNDFHILQFSVKNMHIGADLYNIDKVIQLVNLNILPDSQPYTVGLLNLAGKIIPVFDLAICFGLPRNESYTLNTPILICSHKNKNVALIVDEIEGIETVLESMLQMDSEFKNKDSLFYATTTINDKLYLLLDMNKVFELKVTENEVNQPPGYINSKTLAKYNE